MTCITTHPKVSVLLPVRNGMPYIEEAIQSIKSQNFTAWELIVVDDGSTDGTTEWLVTQVNHQIRRIGTGGQGLVSALNLGLAECRGDYVARMDADDVSLPDRFRIQVQALEQNPTVAVVCSDIEMISVDGRSLGKQIAHYDSSAHIISGLNYSCTMKPIIHPSAMIRRDVITELGGYREYASAEDKDLWLRILAKWEIKRVKNILLRYRMTPGGVSRSRRLEQATSSLLATINFMVNKSHGVDMYTQYPLILQDLRRLTANFLVKHERAEQCFSQIKEALRSKRLVGVKLLVMGLIEHRALLFPRVRDASKLQFAQRWVENINDIL